MRVADYIIKRLVEVGIGHVFMVTGRGVLYLSDAVAANTYIKGISTHHEQGAAYAAYAYGEYTGKFGVCIVSTGCASTNAITSVMCAWQDDVPMIVVSGQNMLKETTRYMQTKIRTYGQQENDIIALVEPITKYAVMLEKKEDIGYVMDKALYEASHGRKGPVWLDIPLDIQGMQITEEHLRRFEPKKEIVEPFDADEVIRRLAISERPVVLAGAGVRRSDALDELEVFLKVSEIPFVYDASAVDVFTDENPDSIGAVGSMGGTRAGNFTVQNADLVLALGCRLSTMLTGVEREKFARGADIIVVDIDRHELNAHNFREMLTIQREPKDVLSALINRADEIKKDREDWFKHCRHWKEIFPKNIFKGQEMRGKIDLYEVSEIIGQYADTDAVVITDAGLEELIFPTTMCLKKEARVIHPFSQGAMGFAVPAVLGAYYASERQIVCVVGDGSIMMNLQELQTIRAQNIPVKMFVINNNCYAVIRERQKELFRNRTIGTEPSNGVTLPYFKKVADCFGFDYALISERSLLESGVKDVLDSCQAVLCEIICTEEQKFLKNSYAMNKKHRILRRTLEDQAPFLDREIIRSEMIVEPIEVE